MRPGWDVVDLLDRLRLFTGFKPVGSSEHDVLIRQRALSIEQRHKIEIVIVSHDHPASLKLQGDRRRRVTLWHRLNHTGQKSQRIGDLRGRHSPNALASVLKLLSNGCHHQHLSRGRQNRRPVCLNADLFHQHLGRDRLVTVNGLAQDEC
jgi:hypothetical protein